MSKMEKKFFKPNNNAEKPKNKQEQIEQIEARAALEKTKARVEILERHKILFISCIVPESLEDKIYGSEDVPEELKTKIKESVGLDDSKWFREGLGWKSADEKKRMEVVHAVKNEEYPQIDEISGIIIGGSPYMVSSDDYPWMKKIENYIYTANQKDIPILGVCFGHQMIAKAFGGKVEKTFPREFGTVQVNLTEEGGKDELFKDVQLQNIDVQMSHSDSVTEINNRQIKSLAFNNFNLNQSIAVGKNIRGIQFHPEITKDILEAIAILRKAGIEEEGLNVENIVKSLRDTDQAKKVLKNFDTYFVLKYALNKK